MAFKKKGNQDAVKAFYDLYYSPDQVNTFIKAEGFLPGGASLHNSMSAHGPDAATYAQASTQELRPQKIDDTLAFMFETRWPIGLTEFAATTSTLQSGYDDVWNDTPRAFRPPESPT